MREALERLAALALGCVGIALGLVVATGLWLRALGRRMDGAA
jgi:hypothetical protein